MKMRIALLVFFALAVAAILTGIYLYNKPVADTSSLSTDHVVSAADLSKEYNENEEEANKKYLGKVLEVEGTLASIEAGELTVLVLEGDELSTVRAQMQAGFSADDGLEGTRVNVKGHCTGLLLDVVLNDCVILKNEK